MGLRRKRKESWCNGEELRGWNGLRKRKRERMSGGEVRSGGGRDGGVEAARQGKADVPHSCLCAWPSSHFLSADTTIAVH